jgi:cell wall-associated NlpC family hydrolase
LRYSNSKRLAAAGLGALISALTVTVATAAAQTGGSATPGDTTTTTPTTTDTTTTTTTGPVQKARLTKKGVAIPPPGAPPAVVNAINAGNTIRKMPYRWGGGHASFLDTGYDCSGAVSYVLNAAGLLPAPIPSGPLMAWGLPGKGRWISVFANAGHTYAVVAGLRWDTSAVGERLRRGSGPRWRATKRSPRGYMIRHYLGY